MNLGIYCIVPSNAVRDAIRRANTTHLLLVNEAIRLADEFPGFYTIARSQATFLDCPDLPSDLDACRALGSELGRVMLARCGRASLRAYMGPNERTPDTLEAAERRGAFEGGVALAVWSSYPQADYVAGNFAVGTPGGDEKQGFGAPIVVAFWRQLLETVGGYTPRLKLGYHGYCDWASGAYWMERRPWTIWKPAVEKAKLPWPEVLITEALVDLGPAFSPNGYRNPIVGSAMAAAYIRDFPGYFREAHSVYIFGCGLTDDWVEKGFEILGDDLVLDAIAQVNRKESSVEKKLSCNIAMSDAESGPFDAWIAAAGGASKVVYDSFRLWYTATQAGAPVSKDDLTRALAKIGSGVDEAKLIAGKLPFA